LALKEVVPMFVRVAAILFLVGCTSSSGQPTGISNLSCPPDSTLTYANFGEDSISTNCLSCHNRTSPLLTMQAQVQAEASTILEIAVYTDAMPRSANMPLPERELLGEWLACGAP
jgi:hypothetical protein